MTGGSGGGIERLIPLCREKIIQIKKFWHLFFTLLWQQQICYSVREMNSNFPTICNSENFAFKKPLQKKENSVTSYRSSHYWLWGQELAVSCIFPADRTLAARFNCDPYIYSFYTLRPQAASVRTVQRYNHDNFVIFYNLKTNIFVSLRSLIPK